MDDLNRSVARNASENDRAGIQQIMMIVPMLYRLQITLIWNYE
jgi:hypothetical protein